MRQVVIPDGYSYWGDLIKCIVDGKKLPLQEINTVGGRSSCKSTTVFLCILILCKLIENKRKIGIVFVRHQDKDKVELIEDVSQSFETYEADYTTLTTKSRIALYGSQIRFVGLNGQKKGVKARKSGFARFSNVDYIIVFFEERFEFVEQDVLAFMEAIRPIKLPGEKEPEILVVNACNPGAKSSPYISYCGKYMSWDVPTLKTTGSQLGIVDIDLGEGKTKRALFHYTNGRVGKGFISEMEINKILDTGNYDKRRASTTDYGLPGYEQGAIYTHVLNNIGKSIGQEHEYLFGGGDYGWGRDERNGKTAFYFGGWTSTSGFDIYHEYVTHNHEMVKTPSQVAEAVVKFYYECMRDYCNHVGGASAFNLVVRVDNMAVGLIQILNDVAKKYKMNGLRFNKCSKFPINDRIEITLASLGRQRVRFSDSIVLLKQEMEMSYYEETQTQKRAKVNDHGINGFEYMIEPVMYKEAKLNNLTELGFRKTRVG